MSFQQLLRQIKADVEARHQAAAPPPRTPDPWEARLADVRGEVYDAAERLPTHVAFDHLGLRRCAQTSGSARRLARVMRHLGWETARFRQAPGSHQRVRGFTRSAAYHMSENEDV